MVGQTFNNWLQLHQLSAVIRRVCDEDVKSQSTQEVYDDVALDSSLVNQNDACATFGSPPDVVVVL